MADDVMDSGERTEAALAAFSGSDDPDPNVADPNAADPNASAVDPNAADPNAADPNAADPNAGKLTDEQLQADPRFQELSTLKDNIVNALSEFPGLVDDKGAVNLQEASLQLKDASILYDIMQGKSTPSALLDTMVKNGGWSDAQKQLVAQDLIQWLTNNKFLKDGQAGAAPKQGRPGFKDPIQERLDKIENERKTEREQQEAQRLQAHREQVFTTKFLPAVEKLCQQKGVPKEDMQMYSDAIAGMVQGNKAIIARIEKGNIVDIQKFFTQVYNAEVNRLQRWTKAQTAAADKKNKNPKIPAGGAPPAPGGSAKVNTRNRVDRIAAATELL